MTCFGILVHLFYLDYLQSCCKLQVEKGHDESQGYSSDWHRLSACHWQLLLVPAICKCQAVQVRDGQCWHSWRWVDVQACCPCCRTQPSWSSRGQTDSQNAPEGSSKHCLLAKPCLKALHFAKSGGAAYNDHGRAQPSMAWWSDSESG